jgi:hypothetical protein
MAGHRLFQFPLGVSLLQLFSEALMTRVGSFSSLIPHGFPGILLRLLFIEDLFTIHITAVGSRDSQRRLTFV